MSSAHRIIIGTIIIASNHHSQNTLVERRQSLVVTVPITTRSSLPSFCPSQRRIVLIGINHVLVPIFEVVALSMAFTRGTSVAPHQRPYPNPHVYLAGSMHRAKSLPLTVRHYYRITTYKHLRVVDRHQASHLSMMGVGGAGAAPKPPHYVRRSQCIKWVQSLNSRLRAMVPRACKGTRFCCLGCIRFVACVPTVSALSLPTSRDTGLDFALLPPKMLRYGCHPASQLYEFHLVHLASGSEAYIAMLCACINPETYSDKLSHHLLPLQHGVVCCPQYAIVYLI